VKSKISDKVNAKADLMAVCRYPGQANTVTKIMMQMKGQQALEGAQTKKKNEQGYKGDITAYLKMFD
jgi:hypothetical protein